MIDALVQNLKANGGTFITFEGGEGSGKSTQSKMLYEYLLSKNIKTIHTREIGGTAVAEKIREIIIHNELLNKSELMLVMAARFEHINKIIIPALLDGVWVICDRFIDSTVCYQSINSDLSINDIYKLHQQLMAVNIKNFADSSIGAIPQDAAEIKFCLMPDITFFIDITPEIGLKRTIARGDNNKFEKKQLEFHQQIYDNFKIIAKQHSPRIITILGENNDKLAVHQQIVEKM